MHEQIWFLKNVIDISSTAQRGGGNFKDGTPIGELGCCDAWMAERTL